MSAPRKAGTRCGQRCMSAPRKAGTRCGSGAYPPTKNGNPIPWAERVHPMRGVPLPRRGRSQTGPPGPGFPPLRPRRGGPRGRPPQHTPRPLGLCLRAGCGPNIARWRSREQARNRGRTLCAPTKNVIRCGGRNISAPPKTGFQYRGRIISAPTKSGNPAWGTVHVRPMKNENPISWEEPIRTARSRLRRGRSQTGPSGSPPLPFSPP